RGSRRRETLLCGTAASAARHRSGAGALQTLFPERIAGEISRHDRRWRVRTWRTAGVRALYAGNVRADAAPGGGGEGISGEQNRYGRLRSRGHRLGAIRRSLVFSSSAIKGTLKVFLRRFLCRSFSCKSP